MSVSATTRPMRPGESMAAIIISSMSPRFKDMVAKGMTSSNGRMSSAIATAPRARRLNRRWPGRDVLFDIDWQGAQQLYQRAGGDVVRVFIFPPSLDRARAPPACPRHRQRRSDRLGRMSRAAAEISHWDGYDYVLLNDDVERCYADVQKILDAERLKRSRQQGLIGFVRRLMTEETG